MPAPDPLALTHATRFPYTHARGHSRSPSRSPLRKSQFAARELDPLLGNLSPDSTLKALQTTETITSEDGKQDALATSITEASPAEREIGIRAAVAAQKLKQWHQEVSQWPWPARRDRSWGAGFLTSKRKNADEIPTNEDVSYLGFLPTLRVTEYEDRIEDIRDGIEALDLEDIKEHIFSAHIPLRSPSTSSSADERSPDSKEVGYGRMRDFTALITATVIQALPELANLTMLLDTWNIRLSVLRQIPDVMQSFQSTQAGVQTAFAVVRSPGTGPLVTLAEYETTKHILGEKVASLGAKIDQLLDLLEGQDDTLPKAWIDHVENIENGYAAWVVEAEHVAIRNDLLSKALAEQTGKTEEAKDNREAVVGDSGSTTSSKYSEEPTLEFEQELRTAEEGFGAEQPFHVQLDRTSSSDLVSEPSSRQELRQEDRAAQEPPLGAPVPGAGHNRGISQVSVADSTFSAVSGLSTVEIADARSTPVLSSPQISVADHPVRARREDMSWFLGSKPEDASASRPPMVQRASTASIEVVSRDSIKQINLIRSRSQDMLTRTLSSSPSSPLSPHLTTPSGALQQLTGVDLGSTSPPVQDPERASSPSLSAGDMMSSDMPLPATKLPMTTHTPPPGVLIGDHDGARSHSAGSPELPRRSSKRFSQNLRIETVATVMETPVRTPEHVDHLFDSPTTPIQPIASHADETLEAKIKDILNTMPTKIRLSRDPDGDSTNSFLSTSSTRSSTPVPSLTLSPAKSDRAHRKASPGDVRVFHLTKSGQSRDVPPVKLFVRAVGEHGERVMVRVGGGWADLAEYLREYSLHHGHRGLAPGNLEVASFPTTSGVRRDASGPLTVGSSVGHPKPDTMVPVAGSEEKQLAAPAPVSAPVPVNYDGSRPLTIGKTRKGGPATPAGTLDTHAYDTWTPPPVPPIPATYTVQSPTMVTTTSHGYTSTSTIDPVDFSITTYPVTGARPGSTAHVTHESPHLGVNTTSASSNGPVTYVPLGAAGPKSGGRRVGSHHTSSDDAARESWVDGMVGKARAVSGGTAVIQGPTVSTTTTVVSRSTPTRRPGSTLATPSPASKITSSPGITASPASSMSKGSPSPAQSKNRKSLGDVSGIRRVFLRRKSDK